MLVSISMATAATPKKKQVVTKTYLTNIACQNCVNKIMKNVPVLGKGVKDVKVNLEKKEVKVTYDASETNDANIINGFSKMNVKAQLKGNGGAAANNKVAVKCDGHCKQGAGQCDKKDGHCKEGAGQCDKKDGHCKEGAGQCDKKDGHCKEGAGQCKEKAEVKK